METEKKRVSMAVIKRLPKYYRYLSDLESRENEKISSQSLGNMMGLTASQIRQDLNAFGAYGQQGYGYNVSELKEAIGEILGLSEEYNCVIIGAGNLGHAIANYEGFRQKGIHVIAMFDNDDKKIGRKIGGHPVMGIEVLEDFIAEKAVDICVLAIPRENAQEVVNRIVDKGIRGILNFVPYDLHVPDNVKVEDVNITDSLFTLTHLISDYNQSH